MSQLDLVRRFQEYGEASPVPLEALAADFLASIQTLGFGWYACCSHVDPFHPPPQSVMLHNYPAGWVRTFSESRLYEIDPILQHAESTLFPFFWNEELRPKKLTKAQRIILAEAAGYGLRDGYTVPIQHCHPGAGDREGIGHGPHSLQGLLFGLVARENSSPHPLSGP